LEVVRTPALYPNSYAEVSDGLADKTHRDEIRSCCGGVMSSRELFKARDWDPTIMVANIRGNEYITDLRSLSSESSRGARIDQNVGLDLCQTNVGIHRGSDGSNLMKVSER
jgi:hypothetical protein